jgi:uncharacterized protein YjbI with pentapeptide repeats
MLSLVAIALLVAVLVGLATLYWGAHLADIVGRHWHVALTGGVLVVLVGVLLWSGYTQTWAKWIGLGASPTSKDEKQDVQRAKTLWDWLQLLATLAIPVVVAVAVAWFSMQQQIQAERASNAQHETDLKLAAAQHQTDLRIADDQAKNAVLDAYMDRMSNLLLSFGLGTAQPHSDAVAIASARTTTAMGRLDGQRNGLLVVFLSRSGLVQELDLSGAHLDGAHLDGADLSGAHLDGADLSGTHLDGADLSGTHLDGADLSGTHLIGADLSGALLSGAYLNGAYLNGASLTYAHLTGADLIGAYLDGAQLDGADLSRAYLGGADLTGADLSRADLDEARAMTDAQVETEAVSLRGTILPSGKKHS